MILKNAFRQKLRIALTLLGLIVAIVAFGLLRTIVDAWYAGVEGTSSARLVTRNAISLSFPLPLHYAERVRNVEGVTEVSWANWFGGIYITERNFFPQFAVDADSYFRLYPEYIIKPDEWKNFVRDRTGAVVGRKLATQYGWSVGDVIPLRGTIYPGTWSFTIRAIYEGVDAKTDESQFFLHWFYLNEAIKKFPGAPKDQVGVFVVSVNEPEKASEIASRIDQRFENTSAETRSETEKAFQLGFVAMTEAILVAVQVVSVVIIAIILAVMANTVAMTVRERISEYATLQALGFTPQFVSRMIVAESLTVALTGGLIGIALTFPVARAFANAVGTLFPIFEVSATTVTLQLGCALMVGILSAIFPAARVAKLKIVEGLRHVA
jgi:putative ABC transport system permease protein